MHHSVKNTLYKLDIYMSVRHIMMGPCHFLVKYRTKGIWETVTKIVYFLWSLLLCFSAFLKSLHRQICPSRLAIVISFNLMYHMFRSVEGIMFS